MQTMETVPEFGAPADMQNDSSPSYDTSYEQLTILPHDFFALSCEEIFDLFVKDKKNHMGACAVYVLPRVGSLTNKFKDSFPQDVNWKGQLGKSIAKKKSEVASQKETWVNLCYRGGPVFITRMKELCVEFFNRKSTKTTQKTSSKALDAATEGAVELDVHDNFAARVAHIVVEEGTKELLETIFQCEGSRAAVDDKQLRVNELWEKIATDFFNVPTWNLELFNQENKGPAGIDFIDPYHHSDNPNHKFTGTDIRVTFNKLKTMYTIVSTHFRGSGRIEGGGQEFEEGIEADDIFYENFAKNFYPTHARKLLYIHLLWGKAPPSFCLRTQQEGKQSQVGVKGTDLKQELGTSTPKKGLQLKEFADNLIKGLNPNVSLEDKVLDREAIKASKDRDIAIEKFYREKTHALAMENESKAPKFHISNFDSVSSLLALIGLTAQDANVYTQRLFEKGYRTPLSLMFAPSSTFVDIGMLEGEMNLLLGVLAATRWGPTQGGM